MHADHPCPWTVGELMALYAIAHCRGNTALAAKLLAHADQHRKDTPDESL